NCPQQKTHDIGSAVLLYRSKFLDCLRGAVASSYPNVDLLWDNVIAGPWGWPRSTVLAKSRPVTNPSAGRDTYPMPTRWSQLVMIRPQPCHNTAWQVPARWLHGGTGGC